VDAKVSLPKVTGEREGARARDLTEYRGEKAKMAANGREHNWRYEIGPCRGPRPRGTPNTGESASRAKLTELAQVR
jgi:hypothetical protein